jgi:hypothetical protein
MSDAKNNVIKKFPWKPLGIFLLVVVLGFMTVKLHQISKRVHTISRGEKSFCPENIECKFNHREDWEVKTPDDLITFVNVVTQQPFYYLAKGFQAYAFISQDGDYVIKFFQQHRLREKTFGENPFLHLFSSSFKKKLESTNQHKEELFSSSKLSFEEIPEETGILYVHLNRSEGLLRGIRLYDQRGQAFKIYPDDVSFIVQRKADYVIPTLTALLKKGDTENAKIRLNQIFDLLLSLANKGIVDGDYALIRNNNMGFIKDRAIYIDTGHLTKKNDLNVREQMDYEFHVRLRPLYVWLKINYPDMARYYKERQREILHGLKPASPVLQAA